ncbi:hypothetical protein [Streptomyces lydicus]|uniref:hypothetical protein n=1 Tax=Streptomyces lydicus TaxID=47763 RepID=UPI001013937C|nr:hypothetical protein [Streptomyces lydicus]MCZ1012186.1 hypothetical protein [Streptomyces lydicus]
MTESRMLWLFHANTDAPHPQFTLLAVDGADALRAESAATAAFERTAAPHSWLAASPPVRRRLVQDCRSVPTVALIHLADQNPGHSSAQALRLSLAQLAEEGPSGSWSGTGSQQIAITLTTVPHGDASMATEAVRAALGQRFAGVAGPDQWPGLHMLTTLTSVACQETAALDLADDEDLLTIYDQYTVGELSAAPSRNGNDHEPGV